MLIEAEVTELQPTADSNYCNVTVKPVGETPMDGGICTCTKFVTLLRRTAVLLMLAVAMLAFGGCVEGGFRQADATFEGGQVTGIHYRSQGVDTKVQSLDIQAPGGWRMRAADLDSNETVTALAQERQLTAVSNNITAIFMRGMEMGAAATGHPIPGQPQAATVDAATLALIVAEVRRQLATTTPEKGTP